MTTAKPLNEQANAYLRNRVMTARPEELRLMLLEGAIRFGRQAQAGLASKDFEQVYLGLTQCQNIILELINGLDRNQAPELCDRLAGLYTFMYNRSIDAGIEKDPEIMSEVLDLLEYERDTWQLLMQKLGEERHGALRSPSHTTQGGDASAAREPSTPTGAKQSISLQG